MEMRVPVSNTMTIKQFKSCLVETVLPSALDLFYPPRCPICEKILDPEDNGICKECFKELPFIQEPYCLRCGKPIRSFEQELCSDCRLHHHLYDEGRAVFVYEKGVRSSINRLKFYNRREYIPFYVSCLDRLLRRMMPVWNAQCLVPIPMHPKKRAQRGFDQAQLLSKGLSGLSGIRLQTDLLIRDRYTASSRKLGRTNRRKNLRGVFSIRSGAQVPESVILIDDIYTTGATMDEASLALRRAGVKRIYFLCVCIGRGYS